MRWAQWLAVCGLMMSFPDRAIADRTCNAPVTATSGNRTLSIVELFTSEGCDSCPPADKWFSTLTRQQKGVIPLAFHVDYWDYIGWKDRFARAMYAERQRDAARRQGSRTVYTPQVMLDGRDFRSWSHAPRLESALADISLRAPRADLSLRILPDVGSVTIELTAGFRDPVDRADADVYIVLTENNLVSRVTVGENRGVTLRHDHVVRDLIGPIAAGARDAGKAGATLTRTIALPREWNRDALAVAAFVQSRRDGSILQGIEAVLCR